MARGGLPHAGDTRYRVLETALPMCYIFPMNQNRSPDDPQPSCEAPSNETARPDSTIDSGAEKTSSSGIPPKNPQEQNGNRQPLPKESLQISRYAILGLLAVVSAGLYPIIKPFIIPVILAATFTTLFYPLYNRLLKLFRNNRPVSALVSCIVLFLCLIVPSYIVIHLVVTELIRFYQTAEPLVKELAAQGENSALLMKIRSLIPFDRTVFANTNIMNVVSDAMKSLFSIGSRFINRTSAGFVGLFTTIVITFFTMFYFFLDGNRIVNRLKYLSPIRDDYEDLIISRFLLISRATVMGTLAIGLLQGTIGALTLLIFGIKSWLLWGFVMVLLAIVPIVGAWVVLIPAGIIQILFGNIWQGVGILTASLVVVSNLDNLIRPRLVGQGAKLHDLVIFFSSLGGIAAFGIMGFIVGPVIASLFISALDIYSIEFRQQLVEANRTKSQ